MVRPVSTEGAEGCCSAEVRHNCPPSCSASPTVCCIAHCMHITDAHHKNSFCYINRQNKVRCVETRPPPLWLPRHGPRICRKLVTDKLPFFFEVRGEAQRVKPNVDRVKRRKICRVTLNCFPFSWFIKTPNHLLPLINKFVSYEKCSGGLNCWHFHYFNWCKI